MQMYQQQGSFSTYQANQRRPDSRQNRERRIERQPKQNSNSGEDYKSPVLYVENLRHPQINVMLLRNIFEQFGSIEKILKLREKPKAFVQFHHQAHADFAKESLGQQEFMGNVLNVRKTSLLIISRYVIRTTSR